MPKFKDYTVYDCRLGFNNVTQISCMGLSKDEKQDAINIYAREQNVAKSFVKIMEGYKP